MSLEPTSLQRRHYQQIVGKQIKAIQWDDNEEFCFPTLMFTDGTRAEVMSDPEGNGPGHLILIGKDGKELHP